MLAAATSDTTTPATLGTTTQEQREENVRTGEDVQVGRRSIKIFNVFKTWIAWTGIRFWLCGQKTYISSFRELSNICRAHRSVHSI
ncbi:hypothetical protein L596_008607 [Steinernema carpocapsae]|uniref:Uncharacterized protein n=1 Tax=Steinernema carpocapsae TaxID=34508 RepID=A0A4U5PDA1_STECR|nr:hypothetical protein L596_008607 [Steinernema carpocapsae]